MRVRKVLAAADRGDDGLFGGLIVLTQGSAVAPFIYTVF
jgi:hypothetical protein